MIIVAGLSADYEIECRMLENSPADLERAEIERDIGNKYKKKIRQQHDSKAPARNFSPASARDWYRKAQPRRIAERKTGDPATDSRVTV